MGVFGCWAKLEYVKEGGVWSREGVCGAPAFERLRGFMLCPQVAPLGGQTGMCIGDIPLASVWVTS